MSVTTINTRIDTETKRKAVGVLHSLGLNTTEAIALYFKQIIYTRGIPFDIKLPNKDTMQAIDELESGKGVRFDSVDDLLKDIEH